MNESEMKGFIHTAPVPVYFLGWQSTTYELGQSGWAMTMEMVNYSRSFRREIQVAFKNSQAHLYMVGELINCDTFFDRAFHFNGRSPSMAHNPKTMEIHIRYCAPQIRVMEMPMSSGRDYRAVDMDPYAETFEMKDIESIMPFRPVNVGEEFEIYLNKKDEAEIMDLVLKKQDKKQKEIRENQRRREWREAKGELAEDPRSEIKAQLIVV